VLGQRDQAISVAASLRALAPAGVRTACRAINPEDWVVLHGAERRLVARAVAKRQHEFASGRAALHELLEWHEPILTDGGRAPAWPAGCCGSLAHDDHYVVAAVSTDPGVRALGIDVEPATPLAADLADVILRPDERRLDAHLAFTLKEAVYKAWSSLGGEILEHHDVRLSLRGSHLVATVDGAARSFRGRFATVCGHIVALVVVRQEAWAWN
jgi:4'-phosphopantetheinyl transferase EntD